VAEVATALALNEVHGLAVRMANDVEPGLVVESNGVNDERVALPFPHRVAEPGGGRILREFAAIGMNLTQSIMTIRPGV
jgi:hypothetical protein